MHSLPVAQVEVWTVCTRNFVPVGIALDLIERSEMLRVSRLRAPSDQDTFTRGYATMRTILAEYLSLPPEVLRFGRGQYGKPFLLGEYDLHFNWSHADEYWLLAVSRAGPVGIDVEKVRVNFDWRGPAEVAFHPYEFQYIELDEETAEKRFFELWTRKEAAFKGVGTGLHDSMARTSVVDDGGSLRTGVDMLDGTCWEISTIPVAEGYVAAVAASGPAGQVETRTYAQRMQAVDRATGRPELKLHLHDFQPEIVA